MANKSKLFKTDVLNLGIHRSSRRRKRFFNQKLSCDYNGKPNQFYKTCPWDKWWDEFLTKRNPEGTLYYSTAWQFAKEKGKGAWERKVIYWSIGPRPISIKKSARLLSPWLGDWQLTRAKQFYYGEEKVQALQDVIAQRLDALDAARGVANITLDWVAKWGTYSQRIDEAFSHMPFLPGSHNHKRAEDFFRLQSYCMQRQLSALVHYLKCHGIGEDDVSVLAQMAAVGATAALKGVQAGQSQVPDHPVLKLMMKTFVEKASTYHLPLPEGDDVDVQRMRGKVLEVDGAVVEKKK